MSTSRHLSSWCAAAALVLYAATSQAHSTFPTLIAQQLAMPCTPACTICHRDTEGGFGTVTEPFGKAMQAAGLLFVESTLAPALAKVEANGTDSDGDGAGDVLELSSGQDPNGDANVCGVARYGCGAHVASAPASNAGAALSAAFTALLLGKSLHRSARRRRPARP